MKRSFYAIFSIAVVGLLALALSPQSYAKKDSKTKTKAAELKGTVKVDGSSTVFPISEAVAEEFQKQHRKVRITVGLSGTGGGMKKFTVGELDITGASRPIKDVERTKAKTNKIGFIELPVAYDGIAVVVNKKNTFAKSMTVDELKRIWQPNSTVKMWSDIRSDWPKKKIKLFGPGADSGTFEYFTKAIVGKAKATRPDFTASEDDNVIVQGVSGNLYALGYFGFAYYKENKERLGLVSIDAGNGPIAPTVATIENATYKPLARPIFIYVNQKAVSKPEVRSFVDFYLDNATTLVPQVGYVPLKGSIYTAAKTRLEKGLLGTVFGSATIQKRKLSMEKLLALKGE